MFGFRELTKRVAELERKNRAREIKENCPIGIHEWEVVTPGDPKHHPFVRCKHCYAKAGT